MGLRRSWLLVLPFAAASLASPATAGDTTNAEGTALRRAHYARVERELETATIAHLTADRRNARSQAIAALHAYREAADFGIDAQTLDDRSHLFVDDAGRRCAVAALLHASGDDALVADVAAANNGAHVIELAGDTRFQAWLDRTGLTLEEAARIQGPGNVPPPPPPRDPAHELHERDPAPEASNPSGTPTASAPVTSSQSALTGGGSVHDDRSTPRTPASGAASWWMWWELDKLEFFKPARLAVPVTSSDLNQDRARRARRELAVQKLLPLLQDEAPSVRAAAAGAIGRLGGAATCVEIEKLLRDPDAKVRERALLALGATGSEPAGVTLLAVARTGAFAKQDLGPGARPLAILALGFARRRGLALDCGADIAKILEDAKKSELPDLALAAQIHVELAASPELETRLAKMVTEKNPPAALESRTLRALGNKSDTGTVKLLQGALAGRRAGHRRSAALALGHVPSDLVAAHLMTAYEVEREPVTRGFLLLAIGRRGGDRARGFLLEQLASGDSGMRPWAALGAGLLARNADDAGVREALRGATMPAGSVAALYLAQGISKDVRAIPALRTALHDDAAEWNRGYAACALGLIGGDEAEKALRDALAADPSSVTKLQCAQALAGFGREVDAAALATAVRDARDPNLAPLWGATIGFHRTEASLKSLLETVQSKESEDAALAAAAEALGLILDGPQPTLPALQRDADFDVCPSWLYTALQTTF